MPKEFLKVSQIPLDTVWYSCDGSRHKVRVIYTDSEKPGWVGYQWEEKGEIKTHEKSTFSFQCRYYLPDNTMKIWPKVGDKIKYKGVTTTWFKELIENAENYLKVGEEYTLARITVNSSWCSVVLKETGDAVYSLAFFEYEEKQTEKELVDDEHSS
jgi:hypothetical protein